MIATSTLRIRNEPLYICVWHRARGQSELRPGSRSLLAADISSSDKQQIRQRNSFETSYSLIHTVTGQLTDATGDFACLVFVFLATY